MKIQIITICDPVPNYGNKLQNYAVQTYLKKLTGAEISTLEFEGNRCTWKSLTRYCLWKYFHLFKSQSQFWGVEFPKAIAFKKFDNKYLKMTKCFFPDKTDYFVVGSDQVWNPTWYHTNPKKKDMFLLSFAKPEQCVCFAPSFGISELPAEWNDWFRVNLEKFPMLNVREYAGADIIKKLTGRDSDVIIDPTLMLSKTDWIEIESKPKGNITFTEPYILTYFLGKPSKAVYRDIERLSAEKRLKVYQIMDRKQLDIYCSGPSEFLYLFHHASLILTDSFHACVFSFIFEKPFLVYERAGAESKLLSRIDTLLELLDLKRKFVGDDEVHVLEDVFEADYTVGKNRLIEEQRKVRHCLIKAFNIIESE